MSNLAPNAAGPAGTEAVAPIVRMVGIEKHFNTIPVLKGVNLDIRPGEVHVLLGENGAGKSTLMKILTGIHEPTGGEIVLDGVSHPLVTPRQASDAGISIIYQELSVINELSALENLFVGRLPVKRRLGIPVVDWKLMEAEARSIVDRLGLVGLDLFKPVGEMPIAHRQIIEIAKSLMKNVRVLVMDEPTSSLTSVETERLFALVRQLRGEGTAILFISHKLDEVREIGDSFSVLKDGVSTGHGRIADTTNDDLVRMMVGRVVKQRFLAEGTIDRTSMPVLKVENVTSADRRRVRDVSFEVHHGEVLGFAGLVGSGRTDLMNCLFGAERRAGGKIILNGQDITPDNPVEAVKSGMAYLTENRRQTGFTPNFTIEGNIAVTKSVKDAPLRGTWGLVDRKAERAVAEEQRRRLSIRCAGIDQSILELSGGNQQKVLVGKWMSIGPSVIIFDEPTRGIDVGAKSQIHEIIRALANAGKAVIMVSSELPEILAVCDRVAVFRNGRIMDILDGATATEESILSVAMRDGK
ncbi:sugar ABC transporter ATP-binding protein [Pleomorphomonas koreensis]|uniref:sugar ABC transporter ATP-binding protein n=1 Tax=Pleomorphomonas koreensis TaxID=257440 RepID=UPI000424865E|nr:ATP-binding cassette domain-containing protein [Pleomorphomonas koreensis]